MRTTVSYSACKRPSRSRLPVSFSIDRWLVYSFTTCFQTLYLAVWSAAKQRAQGKVLELLVKDMTPVLQSYGLQAAQGTHPDREKKRAREEKLLCTTILGMLLSPDQQ